MNREAKEYATEPIR